jgi:hypothetical protein
LAVELREPAPQGFQLRPVVDHDVGIVGIPGSIVLLGAVGRSEELEVGNLGRIGRGKVRAALSESM